MSVTAVALHEAASQRYLNYALSVITARALPDVRDGLTRLERVVLVSLNELERERPGRMVPTAMLYGRDVERIDITPGELQRVLARLGARPSTPSG